MFLLFLLRNFSLEKHFPKIEYSLQNQFALNFLTENLSLFFLQNYISWKLFSHAETKSIDSYSGSHAKILPENWKDFSAVCFSLPKSNNKRKVYFSIFNKHTQVITQMIKFRAIKYGLKNKHGTISCIKDNSKEDEKSIQ